MSLINANKTTDYPIQESQRKCTDRVCTCIGLTFTFILLLLSLILYNYTHQIRTSFPSDSQGRVCGFEVKGFPYIYFANFPQIDRRVCVSSCPNHNATSLNCVPTQSVGCVFNNITAFYVGYYPSQPVTTPIGSYCQPTNPVLRNKLYQDIGVSTRLTFFNELNTIIISLAVGLVLSIVFTLLVQFLSKRVSVPIVVVVSGSVVMVLLILFILIFPSSFLFLRIIFSIILILLLISIYFGWKNQKGTFKMYRQFMNHSTQMLKSQWLLLVYVPVFLGIMALFLLGISWELRSLWSSGTVTFNKQFVFWQFSGGTAFWTFLVFIQTVWGLSFIKQACIYSSTQSTFVLVEIQLNGIILGQIKTSSLLLPLKYLFLKHFGSVIAGSFLTGWFTVPDYIFDTLRSNSNQSQGQPSKCKVCLNSVDHFFDLVRSDCMCYIYVSGNPYCNSARYCQFLCAQSSITNNSQSISRFYRICAHFLLAGFMAIINLLMQGTNKSVFITMLVFVLGLFTCTFFISLHADATESIQILFLLDQYFADKQIGGRNKKELNDSIINKMKLQKNFAVRISQIKKQSQ